VGIQVDFNQMYLQVVIEDCVKLLHESIESGQQYDIVINDLTEIPLEDAVKGTNLYMYYHLDGL